MDAQIFSVAANPQNPNTLYAAGSEGAFFRSYDAGKTWDALGVNGYPSSDFSTLFVHPVDTNVVFLSGTLVNTLLRSTHNGDSWIGVMKDTISNSPVLINDDVIISDPYNSDILYLVSSNDPGFWRSNNRGLSWTFITYVTQICPDICALTLRPDSSNILIAGTQHGHILKSIDSGFTWQQVVVKLAYPSFYITLETPKIIFSPNNPMIGYATMSLVSWDTRSNGGIYKTTDGGDTWNRISALKDSSIWALAVRPMKGQDQIFIGGWSGPSQDIIGAGIVRYSNDGGNTWNGFPAIPWGKSVWDSIPGDVWMLKFLGTAPNDKLYMATNRGLFVMEPDPSGVEESAQQANNLLSVSPDGKIYFQSEAVNPSFRIANLLGQVVAEGKLNERDGEFAVGEFSLSGLPHGVYVAQVSDGKTNVAKVFVAGE